MTSAELAVYRDVIRRRGCPGTRDKSRAVHHGRGGGSVAKNQVKRQKRAEAAEQRVEESAEFRAKHIRRLDEAQRQGGVVLSSMLIFSDRLKKIAGGGDAEVAMSDAQERRVRAQCLAVASFYRALTAYYPEKSLIECAAIAETNSGCVASRWTIYRWSLEYVSNGGKFLSDGRGDFDHDCFITSNEDIKSDLRSWMRANLKNLNRARAAQYINEVLIPKHVGLPETEGEERTPQQVHAAIVREMEGKWRIKGSVCEYTASRWMALAGGEYVRTEKNYSCDTHESEENRSYRRGYLLRDQGTLSEPSERELGQHNWIQMTKEKAEGFFAAHTGDGAAAALRGSAHYFEVSGVEAGFVDDDGVMTDAREKAAMETAVAAALPHTRGAQSSEQAAAAVAVATASVEASIAAKRANAGAGAVQMVELHVELSEALDSWRADQPRGGRVSVRYGREKKPIIINGQDESIFNSEAAPSRKWMVDGKTYCTPKSGAGLMVSAFVNTVSGFGLPMTEAQLAEVNRRRDGQTYICGRYGAPQALCKLAHLPETDKKMPLKESPGIRYLHYGKDKDGYWDSHHMMVQMEDCADCLAVLFPDCQIIDEYDWSGVHGIKKADALDAASMNVKFGGAVAKKHDTTITAGCLGPFDAKITVGESTHDRKLTIGETQSMVFLETDPPPFYDLTCPKNDVKTGAMKRKRTQKKKSSSSGIATQMQQDALEQEEEPEPEMEEAIRYGYVGKPKGLLDVLFERGFLDPERLKGGKDGDKILYTKDTKRIDGIPDESYSLSSMMAQCRDFQNEPTAMEELTELLGHKQEKTPKKHPEIAGRGIEYCWGKAKMTFRHNNNYSSNAKNLESRVRDALDSSTVLTKERTRKFNRKASDYKRSYMALDRDGDNSESSEGEGEEVEYADIEKLKKKCKTHRCTLDQDYAFIQGS